MSLLILSRLTLLVLLYTKLAISTTSGVTLLTHKVARRAAACAQAVGAAVTL
jgi:hypothetical protein